MELGDLGYDAFFESSRRELGLEGYEPARVTAEYRGAYKIRGRGRERLAEITGRHMFVAEEREDYPAVGDWVAVKELDAERAMIQGLLHRKTILRRKYSGKFASQVIAANIDLAFIVASTGRDYNLNRYERYLALARDGGIRPVMILNKVDLISASELDVKAAQIAKRFTGISFVPTSAFSGRGGDELREMVPGGSTCCFLGSSGAGKSSLINMLLQEGSIRTEGVSSHTGKGRHTTTGREMYFLPGGGIVIDNPGMREIGMADSEAGISDVFAAIEELSGRCRFKDCTHTHEPGCAVQAAIAEGELDEEMFSNYVRLKREAEHYEMTRLEKRRKDRQFGKFIKDVKKQRKELEP